MSKRIIKIIVIGVLLAIGIILLGPGITLNGGSKECVVDADCVLYGKTGLCHGCYNKNNLPLVIKGLGLWASMCSSGPYCKCFQGKCGGTFKIEKKVSFDVIACYACYRCDCAYNIEDKAYILGPGNKTCIYELDEGETGEYHDLISKKMQEQPEEMIEIYLNGDEFSKLLNCLEKNAHSILKNDPF